MSHSEKINSVVVGCGCGCVGVGGVLVVVVWLLLVAIVVCDDGAAGWLVEDVMVGAGWWVLGAG